MADRPKKQFIPNDAALERLIYAVLDEHGMCTLAVALILMQAGHWVFPIGQPHLMTRDLNQISRWIDDGVPIHGDKPTRQ